MSGRRRNLSRGFAVKPVSWHIPSYTSVNEEQAEILAKPRTNFIPVEVHPPFDEDCPASLYNFIRGVTEIQTRLLRTTNASPTVAYEIRRSSPDNLVFQFVVPSKRLERKLRTNLQAEIPAISFSKGVNGLPITAEDSIGGGTNLQAEIPAISFSKGVNGLPITAEDSIGGGLLTPGLSDYQPFHTEFRSPPINAITGTLHPHAMRDTRFVVQVLFQPVIGEPVRQWWWRRRARKHSKYLRGDKETLTGSRAPSPRERRQANMIDEKVGNRRFWTSIRFLVIGAGDYTISREKELAGAFNLYENPVNGQYLGLYKLRSFRQKPFLEFTHAVCDRRFAGYSLKFQTSIDELAAFTSIPDRRQQNIRYAQP
uniref:hypothetical protein n=1 Tax=Haloferax gibbonsii TaxID=35746 RepID=UPI001EF9E873|nr:hypothetical protein [Haloferax gibbonsii]